MTIESRIPRILDPAPDFKAKSTHGVIQLSDYTTKGKYVLLFSHPSGFTQCAPPSSSSLHAAGMILKN